MTNQPPNVSMDELMTRHETVDDNAEDVLDVARLFNQVGTSLTNIDHMNLEGNTNAMKLDKNVILNQLPRDTNPSPSGSLPVNTPSNTVNHPQTTYTVPAPMTINTPAVTVDHKTYDQHVKRMSTFSRKVSKVEKDLDALKTIMDVKSKPSKYTVTTQDVSLTTSCPMIMLSLIAKQIDSKVSEITISKC